MTLNKRGQIFLFIIIGVLILILFVLVVYSSQQMAEEKLSDSAYRMSQADANAVQTFITTCLEEAARKAVFDIGYIGGNKNPGSQFVSYDSYNVALYDVVPSIAQIEETLSNDIVQKVDNCLDMEILRKLGFGISDKEEKTLNVLIFNNTVVVRLEYPVTFERLGDFYEVYDFEVRMPINLGEMLLLVDDIVDKASSPYDITDDCDLYQMGGLTNVYISDVDSTHKVIRFIDYSTYYKKYLKSYVLQIGTENLDIQGVCSG